MAGDVGRPLGPSGEQLEPVDHEAERAEIDGRLPFKPAKRGRGRPPGPKNWCTEKWIAWLSPRYVSPLIMFAETYSRPASELAAEFNITMYEAIKLQILAAKELEQFTN